MNIQPSKGNLPDSGSGTTPEPAFQQQHRNPAEGEDAVPLRERRTNPKGRPEIMLMNPEKMQQMLEVNAAAEFERAQRAAQNTSLDRGLMVLLGAIAFFLTGAALGWGLGRLQRPETAAPEAAFAAAESGEGDFFPAAEPSPTREAANAARATLTALAGARSVEDRLPWVLDPERVRPAMEQYYRDGSHDDLFFGDMEWEALPVQADEMAKGITVLGYKPGGGEKGKAIILFFKRDAAALEGKKYRLDWETYLQQRENTLHTFFNDPQSPPSVFRIYAERKHLFGQENENALGCEVRCLSGGGATEIVVAESDPLHRRLSNELKWGQPVSATVELEWRKPPAGKAGAAASPQPVISRFYCRQLAGLNSESETRLGSVLVPLASGQTAPSEKPAEASAPEASPVKQ